jgi:hypothetical protein
MDRMLVDKILKRISEKDIEKFFRKKEKEDRHIAAVHKKFSKMPDIEFDKYVKNICKGYNEDPYLKKPFKYVKEMWDIIDVVDRFGNSSKIMTDDGMFAHCAKIYRGFRFVLVVGQGSFWYISKGKEKIGSTYC